MERYGIMNYEIPVNPNGFNTISQHNDRFLLKIGEKLYGSLC